MAEQLRTLAVLLGDPGLQPRIYVATQNFLTPRYRYTEMHINVHAYKTPKHVK